MYICVGVAHVVRPYRGLEGQRADSSLLVKEEQRQLLNAFLWRGRQLMGVQVEPIRDRM